MIWQAGDPREKSSGLVIRTRGLRWCMVTKNKLEENGVLRRCTKWNKGKISIPLYFWVGGDLVHLNVWQITMNSHDSEWAQHVSVDILTQHTYCVNGFPVFPMFSQSGELKQRVLIWYLDSGCCFIFLLQLQRSPGGKQESRTMGPCGSKVMSCML